MKTIEIKQASLEIKCRAIKPNNYVEQQTWDFRIKEDKEENYESRVVWVDPLPHKHEKAIGRVIKKIYKSRLHYLTNKDLYQEGVYAFLKYGLPKLDTTKTEDQQLKFLERVVYRHLNHYINGVANPVRLTKYQVSNKQWVGRLSLDGAFNDPYDGEMSSASDLILSDAPHAEVDITLEEKLAIILKELSPQEATILKRSYGLGYEPQDQETIASELGTTIDVVKKAKAKVLKKLRKYEPSLFYQSNIGDLFWSDKGGWFREEDLLRKAFKPSHRQHELDEKIYNEYHGRSNTLRGRVKTIPRHLWIYIKWHVLEKNGQYTHEDEEEREQEYVV